MLDILTLIDRSPAPLRRLIYRIANGEGVLGRIADSVRFRFDDREVPSVPALVEVPVRLLIGPANTAGQGYEWARAVERAFPVATAIAMHGVVDDPYQPKVDLSVPLAVYQRSAQWHARFQAYVNQQTHVILESGMPIMGRHFGPNAVNEIEVLRRQGVQCALLFHGSDIRPPSAHARASRWSPFLDHSGPLNALEESARRNKEVAVRTAVPVFVSTPDLTQWLPQAIWCPVVVDTTRWRAASEARSPRERLVVVHAPSSSWLKGTDMVEPTLRRLAGEGLIDYRRVTGVPHSSMPSIYADADIVLDQFRLGIYGVAACEAMASGRLVMSHVDEYTRSRVRQHTGWDLPIHEVTIESLEEELRRAVSDPFQFEDIRAAGPAFVDEVHDGRYSATALAPFLGV